jgi:hypothetical protein
MDSKPPVNTDRVDDAVPALLFLRIFESVPGAARTWKSFDWDAMSRLHERGLISDPVGKAKSVLLTEEGLQRAELLFEEFFRR